MTDYFRALAAAPPPLSTRTAVALLVLYALVYFLPFYASRTTCPSATLPRDAPSVIRARITSVVVSCAVCWLATFVLLLRAGDATVTEALHLMSVWPVGVSGTLRALFLTALLFLGPLFSHLVVDGGWRAWAALEPLKETWQEWTTWRNIVAGPVTEEFLFRSASIPLLLLARTSPRPLVFFTPVIFGLAHFHHFYEFRLTHPRVPIAGAFLRSLFQFAFTTIFGAYATFLYLRTASLLAVCSVHAFCNALGLPQLWGRVQPPTELTPMAETRPKDDAPRGSGWESQQVGEASHAHIGWTVTYYGLLVLGAVSWWRNLWSLTQDPNALIPTQAFSLPVQN